MWRAMWRAFWTDDPTGWGGMQPIWLRWVTRLIVVSVIVTLAYHLIAGTL